MTYTLDMENLGKEIYYLRKKQGFTQKELAEGICTQPAISKIEKGEVIPSVDVLFLIASKLKVNITHLLGLLFEKREDYISETIHYIENLTKNNKYSDVLSITSFELKQNQINNKHFDTFLKWQHLMALYYCNQIDWKDCLERTKTLLSEKPPYGKIDYLHLKIKNFLANLYTEIKDYERSFPIYEEILEQDILIESFGVFRIKVLYNYANSLYRHKKYQSALPIIDKGIQSSISLENMSYLGALYYLKGICLEQENEDKKHISHYIQQAYFILKIMGRTDYVNLIESKKQEYLINVSSYAKDV